MNNEPIPLCHVNGQLKARRGGGGGGALRSTRSSPSLIAAQACQGHEFRVKAPLLSCSTTRILLNTWPLDMIRSTLDSLDVVGPALLVLGGLPPVGKVHRGRGRPRLRRRQPTARLSNMAEKIENIPN